MTSPSTATFRFTIGSSLSELAAQLGKIGLNLSLWDKSGRLAGDFGPCCELCRAFREAGNGCAAAARRLAAEAVSQDEPQKVVLPAGCCVLAVPLRQRRRVLGAAVGCYPAREMVEEEFLKRLCGQLDLDFQTVFEAADRDCRHRAADVGVFLGTLEWIVGREQERVIARNELNNLSANLAATYEELSLLYRISGSMRVTKEPADFLHMVCEDLLEVMNISAAAAVEFARPSVGGPDTVVIAGELNLPVELLTRLLADLIAAGFAEDNRAIVENNFAPEEAEMAGAVRNFVAVPLVAEDERIGVLVGLNKVAGEFDSIDMKLLSSIGNQTSAFLANSRLYADRQELLMGVLHALTASIDAKDPYTCGHSQRVAILSKRIAEEMGFTPEKVELIYLSGLLHDIGKIGVPEAVLTKPGKLTEEEYDKIQLHPSIGGRILGGIHHLDEVVKGLLTHHERPDGKGYPQGLSGGDLPVEGLIIGLADSLDAMTSDRTYRKAMPLAAVIEEIRRYAGMQFDEKVVEAFLSMDIEKLLVESRQEAETVFPVKVGEERWK